MQTFALKTHFNGNGNYKLLQWYTLDRGNHLIIGRTNESILTTLKSIVRKYGSEVVLKGYRDIKLVYPDKKLLDNWRNDFVKRSIRFCLSAYVSELKDVINDDETFLSKGFVKCTSYNSDRDEEDLPIDEDDRWRHWECKNCYNGYTYRATQVSFQGDEIALFMRVHERYLGYKLDDNFYPKADRASGNKDIWVARADFGHHCSGVYINMIDSSFWNSISPKNDVLFFFYNTEKAIPREFNDVLDKYKENEKIFAEAQAKARQMQRDKEKKLKAERLLSLLED